MHSACPCLRLDACVQRQTPRNSSNDQMPIGLNMMTAAVCSRHAPRPPYGPTCIHLHMFTPARSVCQDDILGQGRETRGHHDNSVYSPQTSLCKARSVSLVCLRSSSDPSPGRFRLLLPFIPFGSREQSGHYIPAKHLSCIYPEHTIG